MMTASSLLPRLLLLILSLVLGVAAYDGEDIRPILMDRRDISPFGDIVSDLKTKTIGGRMRFGKRSIGGYQQHPSRYQGY